jgi:hypothetical protein
MAIGFPVPLDAKGVFTLLPPFDNALTPFVIFTCISNRRLADCISSGEDAFVLYYEPFGLTLEDFNKDLVDGESLVSLQSSRGEMVHVPNRYVSGMPVIGGVPYTKMMIVIDCGFVATDLDLGYLQTKLVDDVRETIGLSSTATPVAVTAEVMKSQQDHDNMETIRKNSITVVSTDYARYVVERDLRIKAENKIKALEDYIKSKYIP